MAHFAKVQDGVVLDVIVAEPEFIATYDDGIPGEWIQTSYNTFGGFHYDQETKNFSADQSKALRKNYATIGGTYDREKDAFIAPKPFPSWVLDEFTCLWEAPIPLPDRENVYVWDEETVSWVLAPK